MKDAAEIAAGLSEAAKRVVRVQNGSREPLHDFLSAADGVREANEAGLIARIVWYEDGLRHTRHELTALGRAVAAEIEKGK